MHWSQLSLLSLAIGAILAGKSEKPDQVRILGRVLSADKRPLGGATVSIRALNIGGVSLADGRYVLAVPMSAVPAEQITLVARADGYCTAAFQLLINSRRVEHDFVLEPASHPSTCENHSDGRAP